MILRIDILCVSVFSLMKNTAVNNMNPKINCPTMPERVIKKSFSGKYEEYPGAHPNISKLILVEV